jgi:hypothetical protein
MKAEKTKQHEWLQKLVGKWTYESECPMGPDKPVAKVKGSETVRSLGDAWVLCEGEGEMPGGGTGLMLMTLGYDPEKARFVGTWVGSMMNNLWVYEGELDASGNVLTLNSEGPDFTTKGKTAKYQDTIEITGPDTRTLTSRSPGPDGQWVQFMKATYRRTP